MREIPAHPAEQDRNRALFQSVQSAVRDGDYRSAAGAWRQHAVTKKEATMAEQAAEKGALLEPGEAYYVRWGWSGCAGSAWNTLTTATKDGWRHAEEAQARATALAQKIDRCTEHLRVALGYADGDRDAGLESLAVQVKRAHALPPAADQGASDV